MIENSVCKRGKGKEKKKKRKKETREER